MSHRIGIAPGTETPPAQKPAKGPVRHEPLPGQNSFLDDGPPTPELDPATIPAPVDPCTNWAAYAAWRKTKTTPRSGRKGDQDDRCEAALGMAGEAAELAELFYGHGLGAFTDPDFRAKLIDEAGDLLFYSIWMLDALGVTPDPDGPIELVPDDDLTEVRRLAGFLKEAGEVEVLAAMTAHISVGGPFLTIQCRAGNVCDAIKKFHYQGRPFDADALSVSVVEAMCYVHAILVIAGSSVGEALAGNVAKINARYPDGFRPKKGA